MTTDPRAAALAEALDAAICNHQHDASAPLNINPAHLQPVTYRSCAAAILAALPPGWCGHEGLSLTEFQRLWANDRADLARLRRIEAAARAQSLVQHRGDEAEMARCVSPLCAALRATLEGASDE